LKFSGEPHVKSGQKSDKSKITREQIENRGYEIYLRRGGENGSDQEDWFAAERELLAEEDAPANPQGWSVPVSARPASTRPATGFESEEERRKIATMGGERSSR
jgi:Protein of unknown function (DUF2934)